MILSAAPKNQASIRSRIQYISGQACSSLEASTAKFPDANDIKSSLIAALSTRFGNSLTTDQWLLVAESYMSDLNPGGTTDHMAIMHLDSDHVHVKVNLEPAHDR